VSIPTERGVILIGGCDAKQCYDDVYRVRWARESGVQYEKLPSLPRPLAYMTGACAGDVVFIAGGQETVDNPRATAHFYTLDLSQEGKPDFAWREQAPWPGAPRIVAVSAALTERAGPAFYLFSGRDVQPGRASELLSDAYRYDLRSGRWETLPPIKPDDAAAPRCVMAGSALAVGPHEILLLGGDPGGMFQTLEESRRQIAASNDADQKKQLQAALEQALDDHPGFPGEVLRFDTFSRRYRRAAFSLPSPAPVTTTPCIAWGSRVLIVSGEVRPGIRTPNVWLSQCLGAGSDEER
jgi:N-acetylneuraminic acid mutarotase